MARRSIAKEAELVRERLGERPVADGDACIAPARVTPTRVQMGDIVRGAVRLEGPRSRWCTDLIG